MAGRNVEFSAHVERLQTVHVGGLQWAKVDAREAKGVDGRGLARVYEAMPNLRRNAPEVQLVLS